MRQFEYLPAGLYSRSVLLDKNIYGIKDLTKAFFQWSKRKVSFKDHVKIGVQ